MQLVARVLLSVVILGWTVPASADQARPVFFIANATQAVVTESTIALAVGDPIYWVTDRPFRQSGAVPVTQFITAWGRGANDFAEDPPNAIMTGDADGQSAVAVVERTDPRLDGGDLVFDFRLLSGDTVSELVNVSVFIDAGNVGDAGGSGGILFGNGGAGYAGGTGGAD